MSHARSPYAPEALGKVVGMASEIFKPIDTSYLVNALSTDMTHAGISTFERTLGMDTSSSGESKSERAVKILRAIMTHPDTDALIIGMLDQLYVQNPFAMREDNEVFQRLKAKVLDPRGVTLSDDGFVLPDGRSIDQLKRTTEPGVNMAKTNPNPGSTSIPFANSPSPWPTSPSVPSTSATQVRVPSAGTGTNAGINRSSDKVFIVHGRDMRPVDVLKKYLLFLGLHMIPWSEAVKLTGKSQPHTFDIVKAGMDHAAAIIVIFSPDDLARVKDEFSSPDSPDRNLQGQARQNVILEAGMAYALAPERTIFLKSAETREISDISGFNWVKLNGAWDSRADLKNRLDKAGAKLSPAGTNLADDLAGPFLVQ